jgi:hypothetical protein
MNGNYLREFWARLTINYPFKLFILNHLVIRTGNWYRPTISFLCEFLTRNTMIQSNAGSKFYTLFSLSLRVLLSY